MRRLKFRYLIAGLLFSLSSCKSNSKIEKPANDLESAASYISQADQMYAQREDLSRAIKEASKYDDEVIIERFVPGRELTVGVLGKIALPVGEIISKHEIYDYECKYTPGMATEEFPAKLSREATERVQQQALAAFKALKLGGCARIDFRLTSEGEFYCLEANTLPGMTELSLIPQGAAAMGISFPELCERIVKLALE